MAGRHADNSTGADKMRSEDSAGETRRTAYLSLEHRERGTEAAPREAVRLPHNPVDWQRLGDEAYEQERVHLFDRYQYFLISG
jgi:hypothetical protein